MTKIAIIGTGHMGTYHTRVVTAHPSAHVTALVNTSDPASELIVSAQPEYVVSDYRQIIEHIDAAIIATPTPTHFAIAHHLLLAGKHVLIEKPITLSYQNAETLFAVASEKNVALHVGHVERCNPAFIALKDKLANPVLIRATRSGPFHPRVAHDSVIMDLMIHDIDLIYSLAGKSSTHMQACGIAHVSTLPDTASAHLVFDTNLVAQITVHRGAATSTREIIVETPTHTLHANLATHTLEVKKCSSNNNCFPSI